MIELDGSFGEGGGQILRTSLALSMITGRDFRLYNIRAGRQKPGLQRQHLTAVHAAAEVSRADVSGDALHSRELTFRPRAPAPGDYRFAIGTAGSTSLVLQTVLPALLLVDAPSTITLEGGTHNIHAPPFEFVKRAFLPLLNRLGPTVTATLDRPGFYPAGGGKVRVRIEPAPRLGRLELLERGDVRSIRCRAILSKLPAHIAERELKTVRQILSLKPSQLETVNETRALGPGNVVLIEIETRDVTEVFTGFGAIGIKAERVAETAAEEARSYLDAEVPVGPHLADQLLLPLALGDGGAFLTQPATVHARTNAEVIQRFLDAPIAFTDDSAGRTLVAVKPSSSDTFTRV